MKYKIIVNYPGDGLCSYSVESVLEPLQLLEEVFGWFNHGSGSECEIFKHSEMRSLSSNDFVRINDQWYQCMSVGWECVTEAFVDEIEKLVVEHPDFELRGPFSALDDVMWKKNHP